MKNVRLDYDTILDDKLVTKGDATVFKGADEVWVWKDDSCFKLTVEKYKYLISGGTWIEIDKNK